MRNTACQATRPNYCDRHIVAMHFYHNLIFIRKGRNEEGSNLNNRSGSA
jgi:hypothetical protein